MTWLIAGVVDRDGRQGGMSDPHGENLYWSNADGWVSKSNADTFTDVEKETLNLPDEGRWVKDEPRTVRLVLVLDAEIIEPGFTDNDLQGNAVIYFESMIADAEDRNRRNFGQPSYRLNTHPDGAALWTWDWFVEDYNEGQVTL